MGVWCYGGDGVIESYREVKRRVEGSKGSSRVGSYKSLPRSGEANSTWGHGQVGAWGLGCECPRIEEEK